MLAGPSIVETEKEESSEKPRTHPSKLLEPDVVTVDAEQSSMASPMPHQAPVATMISDARKIATYVRTSSMSQQVSERNNWTPRRTWWDQVISSPKFDLLVSILVLVTMTLVIRESDILAQENPDMKDLIVIRWITVTVLAFYTIEVSVRLYVLRWDFFIGIVNWNTLDLCLVSIDWCLEAASFFEKDLPSTSVMRIMRILRAMRVFKTIRSLTIFRELYVMLHGFFSSMRAIMWAFVLLSLMLTLWSILAVNLIHPIMQEMADDGYWAEECDRCPRAFSSVWTSNLTFFQMIVAGEGWEVMVTPVMELHGWTAVYFMAVFVSINLGLTNLILSVIVDKAQQAHAEDAKYHLQAQNEDYLRAQTELKDMCRSMDRDSSGGLTLDELVQGYDEDEGFKSRMQLIGVTREDITLLFAVMDDDNSGAVDYKEFVEQLYKMRTHDTAMVLVFMRSSIKEIRGKVTEQLTLMRKFLLSQADVGDDAPEQEQLLVEVTEKLASMELEDFGDPELQQRRASLPDLSTAKTPSSTGDEPLASSDASI